MQSAPTEPSGEGLARQYCGMCHRYPAPALLDKKTWVNNVLPNMGWRLGIRQPGEDPYNGMDTAEQAVLRSMNVYPDNPVITPEAWKKIVDYYEQEASVKPTPQPTHPPIDRTLDLFGINPLYVEEKLIPQTTLLKFDRNTNQLFMGDASNFLYVLDHRFTFQSAWQLESPAVDIDFPKQQPPRLLTIGTIHPSGLAWGRFLTFDTTGSTPPSRLINIPNLPRPVEFSVADLNGDDREDLIVCGFGHYTGKLSWYDNFQSDQEHVLSLLPGTLNAQIEDFNRDGKPDIMALTGQALEGISIFYNQGNGQFEEKRILNFHPAFGSSYFELADFNGDGHADILLTNGDNWDYSRIDKSFHGVRIYFNDGNDNFNEAWFFPLHGASKAIARDFDNDGDLDIAAIAFYSSENEPGNGFMYFSNEGSLDFKPHSFPSAATGKWLCMEVADFDHDGDEDIVLGAYIHNLAELNQFFRQQTTQYPHLLVLTNRSEKISPH
ncbi:FG-GAP repeat domain-containing protein [Parapedobacter indicus]|uniref:Repeat domain-containing protein n=1 Tax=Parapedobacter indicus TaxID=1477437 RepID=A0A1I3FMP9_9SPHI|nr:VCBS repeat-containing protein [Parapedobacter indicus]PPL03799.1 VCBS repeat protein [Parapedobacter indicus]SFI12489.1 Repeat domain-containing protein [Parapedobacter indicus]